MDSSICAEPETITPSAGTLAPGRTTTTSSTRNWPGETTNVCPPSMRSASSGSSAAKEPKAEAVWANERISTQWPSNIMTTNRANSHQKSRSDATSPSTAAQDATKATEIARPISSIMPGCRDLISPMAPLKKGWPTQKYMTVPRTGQIHAAHTSAATQ